MLFEKWFFSFIYIGEKFCLKIYYGTRSDTRNNLTKDITWNVVKFNILFVLC